MRPHERDTEKPFFLLAIETNPGCWDIHSEIPDLFDDLEAAQAEARRAHEKFGCGAAVFDCQPAWQLAAMSDEDAEALPAAAALFADIEVVEEIEGLTAPATYEVGPDELGPKRLVRVLPDDPGWDATDAAHPAWWRGNEAGSYGAVAAVNRVLDSLGQGKPYTGHFSGAELELLKDRLQGLLLEPAAEERPHGEDDR
jgi:hypothetical protein